MITQDNLTYEFRHRVIWLTHYQKKLIAPKMEKTILDALYAAAEKQHATIQAVSIYESMVDLIFECDPRLNVHTIIKYMKNQSAKAIKENFPEILTRSNGIWTRSYLLASVGSLEQSDIDRYRQSQPTYYIPPAKRATIKKKTKKKKEVEKLV